MDATLKQAGKVLELFEDTSREQVQALLASGFLADLRDANIAKVSRDEFRRLLGLRQLNPPLLETVGTVTVPAITELFIAEEKFSVGDTPKIVWVSGLFRGWFGSKTEKPMAKTELRIAKLTKSSVDGPILEELGECAETTLSQIHALLAQQPNGEQGLLLTNGLANIFYCLDIEGTLRAVRVHWGGNGWYVDADSVEDPFRWSAGSRVFSRNSLGSGS
ncbi:MAG: hypothetical protein A3J30_01285 [Candidatus Wildermuthbacteria bacterium RIFCSPLOWO2_02_FULL_47_9c]|uniref:Uncharacterized protein n=2 Tax=Candidatus Wildermuthiibacteriota TaxID=1817923 RepID=A0A1G2RUU7_9BACT|nr:MAG: hypothetical protein A2843_02840 [Candidatus Wildermuthbacteria bacterium RIFCSPHIGHO2_01_FULL_48_27b]OHA76159.1 MAG: hypothetical protein A3J30_01285 [Candidatus Wildermuthbacteria bacterium RIFCSPLOWO2_02_FULL_47_9c]